MDPAYMEMMAGLMPHAAISTSPMAATWRTSTIRDLLQGFSDFLLDGTAPR